MLQQSIVSCFVPVSMDYLLAVLLIALPVSCASPQDVDFYSLNAKDIQGNEISLEDYKGKVNLIWVIV